MPQTRPVGDISGTEWCPELASGLGYCARVHNQRVSLALTID